MESEVPIVFECEGDKLIGIIHHGQSDAEVGVVMIVGGPQYRVGSHRQYVSIARLLADSGLPVLRFDARGMGDAEGRRYDFESIGDDIHSAIDALMLHFPVTSRVVLFGLCDAASAILMYAEHDSRVSAMILMNPWARTDAGEARAYMRHYYVQRLLQRSFWTKVLSGEYRLGESIKSFARSSVEAIRGVGPRSDTSTTEQPSFLARMESGFTAFSGPMLVMISERDLTAAEFMSMLEGSRPMRRKLAQPSVTVTRISGADHTLSNVQHLQSAAQTMLEWVDSTRRREKEHLG